MPERDENTEAVRNVEKALHFGVYNFVRQQSHPWNRASGGRWPRGKGMELRTGRGNDGTLLACKMNRTQHLAILYDIYCLML